jgi:putative ABC transport system permease protein
MILLEALRMAAGNLWGHRMRSVLTILGVIIGVGSVLAVVTMGKSFEESIVSEFDALDERTVYVYSSLTPIGQGPPNCMQFCNVWTERDLEALRGLGDVERVTVSAQVDSTSIALGGKELTYEGFTGTVPEADELRKPEDYASGGAFALGRDEVVLGWQVAQQLGAGRNVTAGEAATLRFPDGHAVNATIAGVLKEDMTLFGDRNGRVYVPIDPFYHVTRASPTTGEVGRVYNGFTVLADDPRRVESVRDAVKGYVEGESDARLLKVEKQELAVSTPSDIQASISTAFAQVTVFIGAIGGVSLLVGAIGIANIMLVSVTERTREIGVMKAIGAKDGEVLTLFLLEAFLIGLAGAVLGIGLGLAGGAGLVRGLFASEGVTLVVPWEWVAWSVLVGVGVGVVAGYLPARRATKIQPVQALAYE